MNRPHKLSYQLKWVVVWDYIQYVRTCFFWLFHIFYSGIAVPFQEKKEREKFQKEKKDFSV